VDGCEDDMIVVVIIDINGTDCYMVIKDSNGTDRNSGDSRCNSKSSCIKSKESKLYMILAAMKQTIISTM
jgi:hypothetical protein